MSDKKSQRFSIDTAEDGAEVPTLTQLLYRKNVVKSQGLTAKGRANDKEQDHSRIINLEPTVTIEKPIEVMKMDAQVVVSQIAANSSNQVHLSEKGPSGRLRVVPAPSPLRAIPSVSVTPAEKLGPSSPASAGFRSLLGKSRLEAGLVFEDTGDGYTLHSIVAPSPDRAPVWYGMELAKAAHSDLIGRLEKFGYAEFSTLGSAGQGNFDRTAFRTAFQAKNGEWVTLVHVKQATGKSLIVALLTVGSIQMHLPAFQSALMPSAKAA